MYQPRQMVFPSLTPMVRMLVIATVVIFLWRVLAGMVGGGGVIEQFFGLTPGLFVGSLYFWQPITYLFLHGGFFHILFNMLALWMFGSGLEMAWGGRPFLKFYLITGAGAGLVSVLFRFLFEPANTMIPTIGASGAIYGILMAYGMLFPERRVFIYGIFPVKVKFFVALFGGMAFLSAFGSSGSATDNFAHVGGMLFAFLYLKGGLSWSRLRKSYYRWRLKKMRERFDVYEGGRSEKKRPPEDDYWIN